MLVSFGRERGRNWWVCGHSREMVICFVAIHLAVENHGLTLHTLVMISLTLTWHFAMR